MTSAERLAEVHRLAVAGAEPAIAQDVHRRLSNGWTTTSRFRELAELPQATLSLGPDWWAIDDLATATHRLGDPDRALQLHHQALDIAQQADNRGDQAVTLNNIGMVHNARGERDIALDFYHRALPIQREVGDRRPGR